MKTLIMLTSVILCAGFISCDKTNKQTSKSADTMVIKKDTMINRSDTSGFNKK